VRHLQASTRSASRWQYCPRARPLPLPLQTARSRAARSGRRAALPSNLARLTPARHAPSPLRRRVYFARGAPAQARLLGDAMLTQALLAAALWVAIKFEGNRCAMPDSSVMARITGGWAGWVGGWTWWVDMVGGGCCAW
jgi:hypothetical protein